jgi:AraC-like DNA-binding protein/DNA-binding transcriptional ArsR family regulator
MAFVRAIVAAYERRGISPEDALRDAGIDVRQLSHDGARITSGQMEALSARAMRQLDDEALGWFSRTLPWGTYGMLCRASLTAPTLGVALRRWCRHHRLLTEDILLTLEDDGRTATLSIAEHHPLRDLREFCLLTSLRYVHGYASWLIDSRLSVQQVEFPFSPPPHADVYPHLFPGPVRFDAPHAALRLDSRYLAMPLHRDEAALQRMLQRALYLTVKQYRRDRLVTQRLRQALLDHPALGANAQAMASHLHVSVRTLHRQLDDEGTSLQQLKDEVRRDRAMSLLRRSGQSVKQVASACGFASDKSFSRAFRLWTGMSPASWRESG